MNQKSKWYGKKQIAVMIFTGLLMLVSAALVGGNNNTVFPFVGELYGWNVNLMNIVNGFAAILAGFVLLAIGGLTRKFGSKKVIIGSLFVTAAAVLIFAWTKNFIVYLIMIVVFAVAAMGYDKSGGMNLTASWWPTKKGVVLGFTTMGIICNNIVYVPLMPRLFAKVGFSLGMTVVAIVIILIAVFGFFIKNTPEEADEYPDGDPNYATGENFGKAILEYKSPFTFRVLLKDKNTWFIGVGGGLAYLAAMSFIASTIPTLLQFGYSFDLASLVFAIAGLVSFPSSFLFGVLDQKIGTRKAFIWYFVLAIVGFALAFFMSKSAVIVWLCCLVQFATQGALCNLFPSYVATKYGRWDYNAAFRIMGTMFCIGAGLGVMLVGLFTNIYVLYAFDTAILVLGLIFMILSNDQMIGKKG